MRRAVTVGTRRLLDFRRAVSVTDTATRPRRRRGRWASGTRRNSTAQRRRSGRCRSSGRRRMRSSRGRRRWAVGAWTSTVEAPRCAWARRSCRRTRGGGRPSSEFFGGANGYGVEVSGSKTRMSGNRFGPGTRTINPLGAWLDDQSADSIPPLLRAVVAHRSAGLLRRTSRRGNSRSRRRRSSQSWRSSGRSRGRTGAAGLAGGVSSCSRSDAYVFGLPRGRASSGIEFSATLAG